MAEKNHQEVLGSIQERLCHCKRKLTMLLELSANYQVKSDFPFFQLLANSSANRYLFLSKDLYK